MRSHAAAWRSAAGSVFGGALQDIVEFGLAKTQLARGHEHVVRKNSVTYLTCRPGSLSPRPMPEPPTHRVVSSCAMTVNMLRTELRHLTPDAFQYAASAHSGLRSEAHCGAQRPSGRCRWRRGVH